MKKILLIVMILFISIITFAEVPIKYNNRMCKMEIIDETDLNKTRYTKQKLKTKVLEFCKDKYIYNINLSIDKYNNYIYVIFYNNKQEQ